MAGFMILDLVYLVGLLAQKQPKDKIRLVICQNGRLLSLVIIRTYNKTAIMAGFSSCFP
jgi:hypothetical protein